MLSQGRSSVARQLVVCLDGTGNRFSHRPTNIIRLLRSLSTDRTQVLPYYDQGVGTFGLKETLFEWQKLPSRLCGLAFGWGLKSVVERAYRFLAENYADTDEIFIFGFSRGAYTARALAALIRAVGLMAAHNTHLFDYAWAILLARDGPENSPDFKLQAGFKSTFGRQIRIRFLGLFDTVKSVGWLYDPVIIPYTANNSIVQVVRHAVSIDERRCFFRQHLWGIEHSANTDVKEVWFSGVHSDIGGGYPAEQAQLALISHRWMLGEALALGLHLDADRCRKEMSPAKGVAADCAADMHNSMTRSWKIAEWLPRRVGAPSSDKRSWQIGAMPPFGTPQPRKIRASTLVHRSVEERLRARSDYRPHNLPKVRGVADDNRRVTLIAWQH
jgi:uncharacterized protein (DUF2235 family)